MNDEAIKEADTWMDYHLKNHRRAEMVGSSNSAERSLTEAAKWAAISTALRLREAKEAVAALRALAGEKP